MALELSRKINDIKIVIKHNWISSGLIDQRKTFVRVTLMCIAVDGGSMHLAKPCQTLHSKIHNNFDHPICRGKQCV